MHKKVQMVRDGDKIDFSVKEAGSLYFHNRLCGDPRAQFDPVGESKPKPQGHPAEAFYQIHLSNTFH